MATVAPATRVEALQHLTDAMKVAAWAATEQAGTVTAYGAFIRQARCDLHALGCTSAELDAAGLLA